MLACGAGVAGVGSRRWAARWRRRWSPRPCRKWRDRAVGAGGAPRRGRRARRARRRPAAGRLTRASRCRSCRRARCSRDLTVPSGTSSRPAISGIAQPEHVAQGDRLGEVGGDRVEGVQQVEAGAGDHAGPAGVGRVGQRYAAGLQLPASPQRAVGGAGPVGGEPVQPGVGTTSAPRTRRCRGRAPAGCPGRPPRRPAGWAAGGRTGAAPPGGPRPAGRPVPPVAACGGAGQRVHAVREGHQGVQCSPVPIPERTTGAAGPA